MSFLYGQDQGIADSLKLLLKSENHIDSIYLSRLRITSEEETDPIIKKEFAERLISLALNDSIDSLVARGYLQKGNAERLQGNYAAALESYFESINYAKKIKDLALVGSLYTSIADVYSETNNMDNAMIYYNSAIENLRQTNDALALAGTLLNAGDGYFYLEKYDSALLYNKEAAELYKDLNYSLGAAYTLGNTGMVYAKQEKDVLAEQHINEAITILEELNDYYPISVYLTYMSDIYIKQDDWKTALSYTRKSLNLAKKHGLKKQISESNLQLSELYEQVDDQTTAYKYYKDYITYRDSAINLENVQQMGDLRTNYEVAQNQIKADYEISQKQIEVNLLNQQKKNQRIVVTATTIALFLIGLLAFGLFRRNKFIQKTKKIIEEEKERSDNLLLNILPEETAAELKRNGAVKAKKYDSVTVLFSDFKGFTSYSENLSPEGLVETIDFYFSKFDAIIEKHGLEKIKTIGDAYMCAGGLNKNNNKGDHAHRMVLAAFEIAAFVEETKKDVTASELTFDIRIGINTGPVVAGVVGTKKFAYDIWGDTVNVASRMESMSVPGKINISEVTYAIIKDTWACEYRGEIEVKNKGAMKMYFVNNLNYNK